MVKIGDIVLENRVVLAPMAGICNNAFRRIIKEMGVGLIYAEMVSDKAIVYENIKTKEMLYMTEYERPIVQQIFGSDKETFVEAALYIVENMKPDIIDINMGCPVPKVALKNQAGSALLKNPDKIYEIVKGVTETVNIPVTVKIRSGWDSNSINAIEIAKICEKAGASAICVHPRTRAQGYTGKANWEIIKQVKERVTIPVIGNGDIKTKEDAKRMLEDTGCDMVMIGRGCLGNPWLMKEIINYIEHEKVIDKPTYTEKINMCLKHIDYLLEIKNERITVLEMRPHIAWYIKGLPNNIEIKKQIFEERSINKVKEILNTYLIFLENGIE